MGLIVKSNHIQYQNTSMFNKVSGVVFPYPTFFRENGKLRNSHFRPKFSKSWNYQIAHIKHWIMNNLTNDTSVVLKYSFTRKFEITVAYIRRWPPTIGKGSKKVVRFHTDKSEYVPKCAKYLFINALFTRLIKIWSINYKE